MVNTPQTDLFNGTLDVTAVVVAVFISLALYNSLELITLVFFTFKRWRGLYFGSLLVAGISIILYTVGYSVYYYMNGPQRLAGMIINNVSWISMVCSQSIILYSRIHLVLRNDKVLRLILIFIIVDTIALYIPTTTLQFSSYATGSNALDFGGYVMEKIQMTAFSIQEIVISAVYVRQIFRLSKITFDQDKQKKIFHLLTVHGVVIALDVALLVLEYMDEMVFQMAFKAVVYSMKAKMEFAVLGDLIEAVRCSAPVNTFPDNASVRKSEAPTMPTSTTVKSDSSSEELVPIPNFSKPATRSGSFYAER